MLFRSKKMCVKIRGSFFSAPMYTYSVTPSSIPSESLPLWPSRSRAASYTFMSGDICMRHANIFAHSHCRCRLMILPCSPVPGRIPEVTSIGPARALCMCWMLAQSFEISVVFLAPASSHVFALCRPSSGFPHFGRFSKIPLRIELVFVIFICI